MNETLPQHTSRTNQHTHARDAPSYNLHIANTGDSSYLPSIFTAPTPSAHDKRLATHNMVQSLDSAFTQGARRCTWRSRRVCAIASIAKHTILQPIEQCVLLTSRAMQLCAISMRTEPSRLLLTEALGGIGPSELGSQRGRRRRLRLRWSS